LRVGSGEWIYPPRANRAEALALAHPKPGTYASKFTGRYEHRDLTDGIGHNPPQEAPTAFAQAVLDVDKR